MRRNLLLRPKLNVAMTPSVRCHTQGFLPKCVAEETEEKPQHVFEESKGMRVSKGVYHVIFVFYIFMLQS